MRRLNKLKQKYDYPDILAEVQDRSEMIFRFLADGSIVYANLAGSYYCGRTPREIIGMNIASERLPFAHEILEKAGGILCPQKPFFEVEEEYQGADGQKRWQRWKIRGIFNSQDMIGEVQAVVQDVTQEKEYLLELQETRQSLEQCTSRLKQVEQTLQQEIIKRQAAQQEFQDLFENADEVIYVHDINGYLLSANKAWHRLLGYNINHQGNPSIYDLLTPAYQELVRKTMESRDFGDNNNCCEMEVLTGDKGLIWLEVNIRIIYKNGEPYVYGIGHDISKRKNMEEVLREQADRFRKLTDTAPASILVIQDDSYRYVNLHLMSVLEYSAEEFLKMKLWEPVHPDFREMVKERAAARLQGKRDTSCYELKVVSKSGREHWIDLYTDTIEYEGRPAIIAAAYDITAQKQLEQAVTKSEDNFRCLADTAPALIYVIKNDQLLYVNAAFQAIARYSREECLKGNAWEFLHPDCRTYVRELAQARRRGEEVTSRYQARILRKDGKEFWAEFSVSMIEFNGEKALLGVAIDITERKAAENKIRFLSYYDTLTGLYNRTFVEGKIKQLDDNRHLPISLIVGDLNGLKIVNDAFGHQQGDRLLCAVSEALRDSCREGDIIARWGGDEFLILLPCTDEAVALRISDRIKHTCAMIEGFPVKISIALGVSSKKSKQENMEQVFKEAEDRMYRNKLLESRSYRSSFLYSLEKTMRVRSHETQEHTRRLREMVVEIGESLELPANDVHNLTLLAALHDIGKIAIPNSILDKPGKLTEDEWELMKKHTEIGYRIALSSPELVPIAEGILAHHERWDGCGYPLGLRGEKIPLIARIVAIVDAYDVMISGRPYQKAMSVKEALKEIERCAGKQFDPRLARLFIKIISGENDRDHSPEVIELSLEPVAVGHSSAERRKRSKQRRT